MTPRNGRVIGASTRVVGRLSYHDDRTGRKRVVPSSHHDRSGQNPLANPLANNPLVRIVFLGGVGEIGRNCFCIEVGGRILVVDCGIMFPDADMPGIDLVLPDFTYLRETRSESKRYS